MTTDNTILAVRILNTINAQQSPDESDVALLRACCPDYQDLSTAELACVVIEEMLERQKKQRRNGKSMTA